MKPLQVSIRYPNGSMTLNLPVFLADLACEKIGKVFKLLFQNSYSIYSANGQSIETLDQFIPEWVKDCKNALTAAEVAKKLNWEDPKSYTKRDQRAKVREKNEALTRDVNVAKRAYDKAQRVQALWDTSKQKYYSI